jgi:hypothetical protein
MIVSSDKKSVMKYVSMGGRQGEGMEEILGEVSGELEVSRRFSGGSGWSGWSGLWSGRSRIFVTMQLCKEWKEEIMYYFRFSNYLCLTMCSTVAL